MTNIKIGENGAVLRLDPDMLVVDPQVSDEDRTYGYFRVCEGTGEKVD